MNGQGGIKEGSIEGVDEAIDSRVSTAALVLGGKDTGEELAKECCISIQGLTSLPVWRETPCAENSQ